MADFPSMPWFVADFFQATEEMSGDAAKTYLFLLGRAWTRGGYLKDDDAFLARLARMTVRQWKKQRKEVLSKFETDDQGRFFNPNLIEKLSFVEEKSQKNQKNGRMGGQATAKKRNKNNGDPPANATANGRETLQHSNLIESKEDSESLKDSESIPTESEPRENFRPSSDVRACIADQMVDVWNEICGEVLPTARPGAKIRRPKLAAAIRRDLGGDIERWRSFCERVTASPFLSGANGKWTGCCIDWCLKAENMNKVLEGNYDPRGPAGGPNNGSQNGKRSVADIAAELAERGRTARPCGPAAAAANGSGGDGATRPPLVDQHGQAGSGGEQGYDHRDVDQPPEWEDFPVADETGAPIADQGFVLVPAAR